MLGNCTGLNYKPGKERYIMETRKIMNGQLTIGEIKLYEDTGRVEALVYNNFVSLFIQYFPTTRTWGLYKDFASFFTTERTMTTTELKSALGNVFIESDVKTIVPELIHAVTDLEDAGAKVSVLAFGSVEYWNGRPALPLIVDGQKKAYAMNFRNYCISVNTSIDGDGLDHGSTRPIPFEELKDLSPLMKMEVIRCFAATTISEYARGLEVISGKTKFDWTPDENFIKFVKEVFNMLWPDEKWPLCI